MQYFFTNLEYLSKLDSTDKLVTGSTICIKIYGIYSGLRKNFRLGYFIISIIFPPKNYNSLYLFFQQKKMFRTMMLLLKGRENIKQSSQIYIYFFFIFLLNESEPQHTKILCRNRCVHLMWKAKRSPKSI